MESPARLDSDSIRDEKVKVLKAIPTLTEKDLVRGQFRGYRNENGVAKDSQMETFAAVKLGGNSWRWEGVPLLRSAGENPAGNVHRNCWPISKASNTDSCRQPKGESLATPHQS